MTTPRYKITDTKGAYMARDASPQLLQLGADHSAAAVYGIRAPVYELLTEGMEIDFDGEPGPHLAPLNPEAVVRLDAYWAKHPNATLDPTRRMPLGQDPMGGKSIEQLVGGLLDAMDREQMAAAGVAPARDDTALLLAVQTLADGQAAMVAAVRAQAEGQALMQAALTALLTHATPKGRAA